MNITELRKFLIDEPFSIADEYEEIISLNIVGSFSEHNDLTGISDIDTVIIIDHLNEWIFKKIINRFQLIADELKNKFGYKLKINSTFGPLKFNEENTVVYHVMIYDLAQHIIHCRKSPFTCYDWQRTELFKKKHISDVYAVRALSPHHFFNARRGIKDYTIDYDQSVISYREYQFIDGEITEKLYHKPMSTKDRYEFAYHIVKFVSLNFLKMINAENKNYSNTERLECFTEYIPGIKPELTHWFNTIERAKLKNEFENDTKELDAFVHSFLEKFKNGFKKIFNSKINKKIFIRHQVTALNKPNTYLGQKGDPGILNENIPKFELQVDKVFSSPSKRCMQTAALISPTLKSENDDRILEINYGLADGKDYSWLKTNHPQICDDWSKHKDPCFPKGENTAMVTERLQRFINDISTKEQNTLIVTHNVVLRCLIGMSYHIPFHNWHLIDIPHLQPLTFYTSPNGNLIPDINSETLCRLLKKIEFNSIAHIQTERDQNFIERYSFWKKTVEKKFQPSLAINASCIIPMAGEGIRFSDFGFITPKPLILVDNKKMVTQAISCLPKCSSITYLVRSKSLTPDLISELTSLNKNANIIPVDKLTEGQACTCALAMDDVPQDKAILIAPCDNGMIWNENDFKELTSDPSIDLICWTFSKHLAISQKPTAWGYVSVDDNKNIKSVSVKKPFTQEPYNEECIIGTFWFKSAKLFKSIYNELLSRNIKVNNEFYVDSMVGLAKDLNYNVKIFNVDQYISWGKPEDLFEYRKWMKIMELLK